MTEEPVKISAAAAHKIYLDKERLATDNARLLRENAELRKVLLEMRHPAATQVFA